MIALTLTRSLGIYAHARTPNSFARTYSDSYYSPPCHAPRWRHSVVGVWIRGKVSCGMEELSADKNVILHLIVCIYICTCISFYRWTVSICYGRARKDICW